MNTEEKETKPRYGVVNFERRKYPRINIDLPIQYFKINSPVRHNARAINVSAGGLLMYLSEQMEMGQPLKMNLSFSSDSGLETIEMLTEVVWMDIHLDTGWGDYRCGVNFIEISSEDMTKLKNFLRSLSQPLERKIRGLT
jgi:c-di-GMP-binding flagellar brake protein YcgR